MRTVLTLSLALLSPASMISAQEWFQHEFGELRAYHGDWLAVCDDNGDGPCRMVQSAKDEGSDAAFDSRLSGQMIEGPNDWTFVVMDRGMPASDLSRLWVEIDGTSIEIPGWSVGENGMENVAETVTVTDPAVTGPLLDAMKAGGRMTVRYAPAGSGDGQSTYSLRGVTAAANAIDARVKARLE